LEKVFGEKSNSPVAGMFRFMPLEGANAVMVITTQADYLGDIEQWLERIDGAGQEAQLYSYELKYIKARDLADRLAEVFGGSVRRTGDTGAGSLMPGLTSGSLSDDGSDGGAMPGNAGSGILGGDNARGGVGESMTLGQQAGGI